MIDDLPDLSQLPRFLRDGSATPLDLLAACRARIVERNGALNAVIARDDDGADRAAEESVDRWRRDAPRSPIDGAPLLVKANFAVAGMPWHAGIAAYAERIAVADAPAVARLRSAGAVILGLTNMDEAALGAAGDNLWLGRIGNPRRAGSSAGGSSGGSAAAVAAEFCMAALGSDTIGSVAIPAACCGVVGHRASRLIMPVEGIVPLSPSFDHAGLHTRSTAGAQAVMQAMGIHDSGPDPSRIAALTCGTAVEAVVLRGVDCARAAGLAINRVDLPIALDDIARRLFEVAEAEGAEQHREALRDRPGGFSPALRRMLAWGAGTGAARRDDHLTALALNAASIRHALIGYDALIMPATPCAATGSPPPADLAVFAALPACLGWPATTIPMPGDDGVALLITAPSDDACLKVASRIAAQIER